MGDDIDDKSIAKMAIFLAREGLVLDRALDVLFGRIPQWIPAPSIARGRRIVESLIQDGFTPKGIKRHVGEAEKDSLTYPGIVRDPAAFAQSIYELAHLRHGISLGKDKGLRLLAGEQASVGQKFRDGRKPGTVSPVRRAISALISSNPTMKTQEIWTSIKKRPPRGWVVYENSAGKYIEGPKTENMNYERFSNICSEERGRQR